MLVTRRQAFIGAAPAAAALLAGPATANENIVTPESFGARGDGANNDTAAFRALAAHINGRGGGEIVLRPVTYLVGQQASNVREGYSFDGGPILSFVGCSAPLVIRGNGARLQCAAGLRYGTFGANGRPTPRKAPYIGGGELATPYREMIRVERCRALVEISDLELDGNLSHLRIGGQYGDAGRQIPASGVHLVDNEGEERLTNVHSHHHPLDGIFIDGLDWPRAARSSLNGVRSDHNGRQGCSVTGGRGYDFRDCRFTATGRSTIASPPAAGIDIEAEGGKQVRDLSFSRCLFANNAGCGMVADSGHSEVARFDDCRFIGTTSWAAWPNKPRYRFTNCIFVGPIVHAYGDDDPQLACRFEGCTFLDDPALSPNGKVYGGENPSRPIADLPHNPNVLFDHCRFLLTHQAVLPWTTNVTIFANCILSQRAPAQSFPRGTFVGRNVLTGNIGLYSARIRGEVILNGRRLIS
jgi:hypothetical protein